jgi:hypothetical protein
MLPWLDFSHPVEIPVIVTEESAALVNTRHPEAQGLRAGIVRRFEYDRLFKAG